MFVVFVLDLQRGLVQLLGSQIRKPNVACRWFIGLGITKLGCHHSLACVQIVYPKSGASLNQAMVGCIPVKRWLVFI